MSHGSLRSCLRTGPPALADCAAPPSLDSFFALYPQGSSTRPVCGPARMLRVTACQTDLARPRRCADPGRSVAAGSPGNPPIRRVDLSATRRPRLPARSGRHGPGRRPAGRFVQLRKGRNCSFRSEGPKGRNRKERRKNDPARPTSTRTVSTPFDSRTGPGRPEKRRFNILFPAKAREFFVSSALRNSLKPTKLRPDHPPAPPPWGRPRTSLPSGCAASTQPGAFVPCVCLCLSPIA